MSPPQSNDARPEAGQTQASAPDRTSSERGAPPERRWTFLSNHAHVLIGISRNPSVRMRDLASDIGISERAVQKIVSDLEAEKLLERHREGRRNVYELHLDQPLRHPTEAHHSVRELVELILAD